MTKEPPICLQKNFFLRAVIEIELLHVQLDATVSSSRKQSD